MKFKILIIDDEDCIREVFSALLKEKDYSVEEAETGNKGIEIARRFNPDIILLDMNLPDISGMEVLSFVKDSNIPAEVIIITAYGTIKNAVEATRLGAYDYMQKPVDNEELLLVVSRALEVKRLQREVEELRSELSSRYHFSNIIGTSSRMNSIFQMMAKICRVEGTVLITGESGTGKELVARAIHYNSSRSNKPFVVVNCGAIPKDLIESEFFGHLRGAFTDAKTEKTGKFELANHGTIFLDEIGDLSPEAQVKLLRAIGEKEIVKVGGTKTIPIDVRVIAATNQNLEELVRQGRFREDLYWRLAVLSLHLPPLRERKEDVPLLCEYLIKKFNKSLNKKIKGVSGEAVEHLKGYSWPGNVRELESILYETMVLSNGLWIDEGDLPARITEREAYEQDESADLGKTLQEAVQKLTEGVEKKMIRRALKETGGNRTEAAKKLGISRKTLFNKMAQFDLQSPRQIKSPQIF
jgi:DNA-binding NtrC family response regulator